MKLHYFEGPNNGLPLLLLHGSSNRWQAFEPLLPELMAQSHLYALDFRGHGLSEWTPGAYTLEDYLKDVITFIQEKIKQPTVIFGHSLGGMVAIMAAASHPELVRGLVIADASFNEDTLRNLIRKQYETGMKMIAWMREKAFAKIHDAMKDDFAAEGLCLCDPDVLVAMFEDFDGTFGGYDTDKLLPQITCPTLILRGSIDKGALISESDVKKAIKLLPSLQDFYIPNVGHNLMREDKLSVLRAVKKFYESHLEI